MYLASLHAQEKNYTLIYNQEFANQLGLFWTLSMSYSPSKLKRFHKN